MKDCDRTLLLCSLLLLLPVRQVAAHGGDQAPKVAGVGGDQDPQVTSPDDTQYPDPRILIVGATGAGKSSLANVLIGCDPMSKGCAGMAHKTKKTTIGTGKWLGTGQEITVVDTPGFGDSSDRDILQIQEMTDVLNNKLGYTNTIMLVLEANTPRFTSGLEDMLKQMTAIFGSSWWDFVVIGVSKWKYSQAAIDDRKLICEDDPHDCMDEAWFMSAFNEEFQEKFGFEKNFTFVFIEAHSQNEMNKNDQVQQKYFQLGTEKLWEFMNSSKEIFPFKTINQIMELNYELKEENTRLKREVESNSQSIARLASRVDQKLSEMEETRDQKISEMKAEMKAELKAEMMNNLEVKIEAKDQRIDSLETGMKTKDSALKSEMEAKDQRISALEEEMKRLRGRMTETEETDLQLREMVWNQPFAFQCAWQNTWTTDNSIITYDRLTYDDISGGTIFNVTGGMDISTGVFTVGHGFSGVYTVTYSIRSNQKSGSNYYRNQAWIYLNDVKIEESYHGTYNGNSDSVNSLGSRTLHMRLEEGDQVTLRTGDIYYLQWITVCFELSKPIIP